MVVIAGRVIKIKIMIEVIQLVNALELFLQYHTIAQKIVTAPMHIRGKRQARIILK